MKCPRTTGKKCYITIKYLYCKDIFKQGKRGLNRACIIMEIRSTDNVLLNKSVSFILDNNDFEKELDDV